MNAARRASHFLTTSWSLCYCKFTATLRSGLATWLPVHPSRSNRWLPTAKTALKHSPSWQVMLHTHTHSMGMQLKAWYIGVKPSEARTGALWSVYSAESAPPQCEQTPIWSVSRGHLHRGQKPLRPSLPYLYLGDAARTVHWVGRVVEDSVLVQRPQPDIWEKKKSRYEQPSELQQPLLFPPHLSGSKTAREATAVRTGESRTPAFPSGDNFHSDCGDRHRHCDALRLGAPPLGGVRS